MATTQGVLLDWRGTLVRDPDEAWWVRSALAKLERVTSEAKIAEIVDRLRESGDLPSVIDAQTRADCSAEEHRRATMLLFAEAGLDSVLAEALYCLDLEPDSHPFYEDVPAALQRLRRLGIGVAVVSDIHFDLRPEFARAGLDGLVDHFVLSFEHGLQKPDPRIFLLALEALGLAAGDTLMVGDRPSRDGGAVLAGIPTLLLPEERGPRRDLNAVLAIVGPRPRPASPTGPAWVSKIVEHSSKSLSTYRLSSLD